MILDVVKIMMLALVAVLICSFLKNMGSSFHLYIPIIVCIIIMAFVVLKLSSVIDSISKFYSYLEYSDKYTDILLKTVIITYVTSFTSDICKDSGYSSIASQIELFGKITIIILSIPVIFELLDMTVVQAFGAEIEEETTSYDYSSIDTAIKQSGVKGFSFGSLTEQIINGEFSIFKYIKNIITNQLAAINTYKTTFINIVLLAVFSGIFKILSSHGNMNTYDTSRIVIMINLIIILTKVFIDTLKICQNAVGGLLSIYESVMPVFLSSVAVITGSITYAAYYQVVLLGVTVVNIIFLNILMGCIKADYYLCIINRITQTERFTKLCEFVENLVKWTCKIIIIIFTGIGCVKGIMAPMSDSFKRKLFYKSARIIPGIGDSIDTVSSAIYGSGVIIKNGIGIGGIVILVLLLVNPLIHITINFLVLKITSAILQPMADKSFVQIIDNVAEIIGLMMLIVSITGFLFIIMIALICAFTNNVT